jgi:hypothetical protein
MRTLTLALFTTSLALTACKGGDGDESSTAGSESSSGTTNTGVDPTTTTNATPGTTGPDETTTAGSATGSTGPNPTTTGEPETSTTVEPETSTTVEPETSTTVEPETSTTVEPETSSTTEPVDTEGTTGEPGACEGLGPQQCMANEACMPIGGGKLNLEKMCVGKPMFLACVPAAGCGDALTYACAPDADPPEPFLFPSTCLPPDWQECDAPNIDEPCM